MVAASGPKDPAVTRSVPPHLAEVAADLRENAGEFAFFQAVRLLLRLVPERSEVGRFAPPEREAVRFSAHNSLSFPPMEIHSLDWNTDPVAMTVNFMGLTGPVGVLPQAYTELITERLRARDSTLAAFFDIFNHRAVSLFYQAWEKYRFPVTYERDGKDRMTRSLLALIGTATAGLQDRIEVRDESLLYYAGLLGLQSRPAAGLRAVVEDYFDVPADVGQFVGAWQELDERDCCELDPDATDPAGQLGGGAVVGDAIWDQHARVRLRIGPMSAERYLEFLPGGSAYEPLRALTRFYCGADLELEVELVLARDEVPSCELGKEGESGPRLGWFTWMKSRAEFDRDPSDTVLTIK